MLSGELDVIRRGRAGATDVTLVDDLRIYETVSFDGGDLPEPVRKGSSGSDGLEARFSSTHLIRRDYADRDTSFSYHEPAQRPDEAGRACALHASASHPFV